MIVLLVLAGAVALADWFAVSRRHRIEYLAKPLTLVLLIAAASLADLDDSKPWVLVALAFGLLGDIALLLDDRNPAVDPGRAQVPFLLGLASFLLGHVAYLIAFTRHGLHPIQLLAGGLVVLGAAALALPGVVRAPGSRAHRDWPRSWAATRRCSAR